ncbi:MAG: tetratricopeptide repeat protein [bacterium]
MQFKKCREVFPNTLFVVLLWGLAGLFFQESCATSSRRQAKQFSSERQQAIQDSLQKAREFEIQKYLSFGRENWKNKMFTDALPHLWKVVDLDTEKKYPMAFQYLGECYLKLAKPDSAEFVYRQAIEKYPANSYFHRMLGWLLNSLRKYEQAVFEYREAIRLDSVARADDYRALGILLVQLDRRQEALPVYEKLVELEPDDIEALIVLANLYMFVGEEEASLTVQERALVLDPQNTKLLYSLGEAYYKRHEFEKAIAKFKQLLTITPEDILALEILGYAFQNAGDPKNAIAAYEKVLSLKPDHKKVLCEMATSLKELKQYRAARSTVRKALKMDPHYGYANIVLGEIYESAANNCLERREDKTIRFDDKLVFELAFQQFQKAAGDPAFAGMAKTKLDYVKNDIPTRGDRHMHPDQKYPRLDCYKWIVED